jgi:hypothetical protein
MGTLRSAAVKGSYHDATASFVRADSDVHAPEMVFEHKARGGAASGQTADMSSLCVETAAIGDRHRVGYRFKVTNPQGEHLVEQQAYLEFHGERIGWLRVLCGGYQRVG